MNSENFWQRKLRVPKISILPQNFPQVEISAQNLAF